MKQKQKSIAIVAALAAAGFLGYTNKDMIFAKLPFLAGSIQGKSASSNSAPIKGDGTNVVAVVNGENITEREIAASSEPGAARAVVVDAYINKLLAAQKARANKDDDVLAAIAFSEKEILARYWINSRGNAIKGSITDEERSEWYKSNVESADYSKYKVKFTAMPDEAGARNIISLLSKGDRNTEQQLKSFAADPKALEPDFASAEEYPYLIGKFVKQLRVGEVYGAPIPTREGFFVIKLVGSKEDKKPTISDAKDKITDILTQQKISKEMASLRKSAEITIK